jgi:hypothetical protein
MHYIDASMCTINCTMVQWTFKSRFGDVQSERQVIATLQYAKRRNTSQ